MFFPNLGNFPFPFLPFLAENQRIDELGNITVASKAQMNVCLGFRSAKQDDYF